MSNLVSLVPPAPLTDAVFPFNQEAFIEIRNYQSKDLAFLDTPPVKALVGVGDVVGGGSTAVVGAVGQGALGVSSSLFKGIGSVTGGLPGGGLLHTAGQGILGGIATTDAVAQQLVDPTKVAREHYHYSIAVKNALPPAINAVDEVIHDYAATSGPLIHVLYENLATQGVSIIAGLTTKLAAVDAALGTLYGVLTKDGIQESLVVGHDKYKGVPQLSDQKNYLQELHQYLPAILKTIQEVKAAFAAISASYHTASTKINSGVTDPKQIFAESHEQVSDSWKALEVSRKTMTYLPYKY